LTPDRMEIQTPPWPRLWRREYHKTLRCSVLRGRAPILSITLTVTIITILKIQLNLHMLPLQDNALS